MADTSLGFDIFARDKASKIFKKVGESAQGLGDRAEGVSGALKGAFAGVAVAGAAAAGVFLKGAIGAAQESAKIGAQTAAVIKSTGGAAQVTAQQVADYAEQLSNLTGVDDEAIQSGQNLLLTFTNIRNGVGKGNDIFNQATKTLTDMSVALGVEPQKAAVQLGKALNDPIKGVSALSRVGVTFTASQKEQIKTLVDSGKTMEAQKVILAELNKEFGGSAAAQSTAADRAKVAFGNLQEQIGTALLPAVEKLSTIATEKLVPALSKAVDWLSRNGDTIMKVASNVAPFAGVILAVVAAIRVWVAVQTALNVVMSLNPIGLIVIAIAALIAGLVLAYKKSDTFRNIVQAAWDGIKAAASAAWNGVLKPVFNAIKFYITNVMIPGYKLLWTVIKAVWSGIKAYISTAWSVIRTVFNAIKGGVSAVAGAYVSAFKLIVGRIGWFLGVVRGIPGAVKKVFSGAGNWLWNAGRAIIDGLIKGARSLLDSLFGLFRDITSKIPDLKGPLDKDKKLLMPAGQAIMGGLIKGIRGEVGTLESTLGSVTGVIQTAPATIHPGLAASAAGGASGRTEIVIRSGGSKLDNLLVEVLQKAIASRGGNVQTVLGR